jgi:hypothetical protein
MFLDHRQKGPCLGKGEEQKEVVMLHQKPVFVDDLRVCFGRLFSPNIPIINPNLIISEGASTIVPRAKNY